MRNIDPHGNRAHALRGAIVEEARRWAGTPYHHQARLKGVGVDCAGLIIGVGAALGIMPFDEIRFREFANYARQPNPNQMRRALEAHLVEIPEHVAGEGDVMWLEWRVGLPMHLAICATVADEPEQELSALWGQVVMSGRSTMIHATSEVGRVVEHGFADPWPDRVNSFWRYPGLAALTFNGG